MGWGDEIIATADARRLQALDPRPVAVRGRQGEARWHPIWDGNPRLAKPDQVAAGAAVQWLHNCGGHRPYLDYARFDGRKRYAYTDYKVEPGEIYLSADERARFVELRDRVVVEPNIKPGAPRGKDWGWHRWQALVNAAPQVPWLQLGVPGTAVLRGVQHVVTRDVREAAAAVSWSRAVVCPEGGLHHCAAAFGVRAVVVFGGYIAPRTTGYDFHENLFTGGEPCGMRFRCAHCEQAMARITVPMVLEALERVLA